MDKHLLFIYSCWSRFPRICVNACPVWSLSSYACQVKGSYSETSIIQTSFNRTPDYLDDHQPILLEVKVRTLARGNPSVAARSVLCVGIPLAFDEYIGQWKGIGLTFPNWSMEAASADHDNASKFRDIGGSPRKSYLFLLMGQHPGIGLSRDKIGCLA